MHTSYQKENVNHWWPRIPQISISTHWTQNDYDVWRWKSRRPLH